MTLVRRPQQPPLSPAQLLELVDRVTIDTVSVRIELKREALATRLLGDASNGVDLDGALVIEAPFSARSASISSVMSRPVPR
jgi:hypothetical protein